jgi:hypothetical protein
MRHALSVIVSLLFSSQLTLAQRNRRRHGIKKLAFALSLVACSPLRRRAPKTPSANGVRLWFEHVPEFWETWRL